ncbi:MAG: hypothetical protein FWE84_06045, partial [Firmicutes bacterium]|nr:hypothetical protein [Bacillota bacterium]
NTIPVVSGFKARVFDVNYNRTEVHARPGPGGDFKLYRTFTDDTFEMDGEFRDDVYKIIVYDDAGNHVCYYVILDNTPPKLSGGASAKEENAPILKNFAGVADDPHYTRTEIYKKSGGEYVQPSTETGIEIGLSSVDGDGEYMIKVIDRAGNFSEYYVIIDNTLPTLTDIQAVPSVAVLSTNPAAPTFLRSLSASPFDLNLDFTQIYTRMFQSGGYTILYDTALAGQRINLVSDGAYKIVVKDKAGNENTYYVTIDNTELGLRDVFSQPSYTSLADIEADAPVVRRVEATAGGMLYLKTEIYKKNGGAYPAAPYKTLTAAETYFYLSGADGDGTYRIVVFDEEGHTVTYYVKIDATPPVLTIFEVNPAAELSKDESLPTIVQSLTADVNDANFDRIAVYTRPGSGGDFSVLYRTVNNTRLDINSSGQTYGDGLYQIRIYDFAGNLSVYYVIVDNSVPQVSITGQWAPDTYLLPVITFTAGESGIKSAVLKGEGVEVDIDIDKGIKLDSSFKDGEYTVIVTSNSGVATEITFILKNTPVLGGLKGNVYVPIAPVAVNDINDTQGEIFIRDDLLLQVQNCQGAKLSYVLVPAGGEVDFGAFIDLPPLDGRAAYNHIPVGKYVFKLEGTTEGQPSAYFVVTINHDAPPPEIVFSAKITNGQIVRQNVTVKDVLGSNVQVTITYNGNSLTYVKGMRLRDNGRYVITAVDIFNNPIEPIEFEISKKMNPVYVVFAILLAPAFVAGVWWVGTRARRRIV